MMSDYYVEVYGYIVENKEEINLSLLRSQEIAKRGG
jgi:hypothetical protein